MTEPRREKTGLWKKARILKSYVLVGEVGEEWYYSYNENKGADQLSSYRTADLRFCFRNCTVDQHFCFRKGKKVQVGKDQEKAQSEKDSHSKNRGGKKPN